MIRNGFYYRLPDGTEVRASDAFPGMWLFFLRESPPEAWPLYVYYLDTKALYCAVSVDALGGYSLVISDLALDDMTPLN